MSSQLQFVLNGQAVSLLEVSPNTTLLEFLRGLGLTGAKEGCAEGDCGACSVVVVERDAEGRAIYRAVNSCLMPVCLMVGREVISVEGVGCSAQMHPVQRAMAEGFGSQCGYCTPGFICSLFEGFYRDDLHTHDDLDDQLSGNLCRCTGYRPIRDAALAAFTERQPCVRRLCPSRRIPLTWALLTTKPPGKNSSAPRRWRNCMSCGKNSRMHD